MKVKTLAPWFGSDRSKAESLGRMFDGCAFVMIPFGGGFSIVPHLRARTIVCNDKHRHIINLAQVISNPRRRSGPVGRLPAGVFEAAPEADAQGADAHRGRQSEGSAEGNCGSQTTAALQDRRA